MRLAILISGGGSNMVAIAHACASGQIPAEVAVVISDQASAGGIERARQLNLPVVVVDRGTFRDAGKLDRLTFETALEQTIRKYDVDAVILAGFMFVLSADFVTRHAGRMLNIHPSLLPRYTGLDTHARVLAAGDREHGASVHFVTAELDGGPLIVQAAVPVQPDDDITRLSARVHAREHIIYPMAIQWLATGRLQWNDGHPLLDGQRLSRPVRHG